jgi:hypothetical protein
MSAILDSFKFVLISSALFACGGEYHGVPNPSKTIHPGTSNSADAVPIDPTIANGDDQTGSNSETEDSFANLVQPVLKEHCGICHATAQTPFFAVSDPAAALAILRETKKLDESHPEQSRIYLRLLDDKHQCWSDCGEDAKALLERLVTWLNTEKSQTATAATDKLKTAPLRISDARIEDREPDNPGTIIFEAESGNLTAPMVLLQNGDVSGGSAIETPELNGAALAANAANAGRATFQFEIETAGTYFIFAKVQGPSNNANAFNYRIDSQAFATWNFAMTANEWRWLRLSAANNQATSFNLTSGTHSLEIRQREDGAKIDLIAITNDAMFVEGAPNQNLRAQVLDFDLTDKIGRNAKFSIDVADFDAFSLKFRNPKLSLPDGQVRIKGIHVLINGKEVPEAATYSLVDKTIAAPGEVISSAAMIVPKQSMDEMNEISFRFELLE